VASGRGGKHGTVDVGAAREGGGLDVAPGLDDRGELMPGDAEARGDGPQRGGVGVDEQDVTVESCRLPELGGGQLSRVGDQFQRAGA
jgi:hypothetical protein